MKILVNLTSAALLLAACTAAPSDTTRTVTLRFAAVAGDTPVACGQQIDAVGTTAATVDLLDARLYVTHIRLTDSAGGAAALTLDPSGPWQVQDVALLDFEDGTQACANGTSATNVEVVGTVPDGAYTGLTFDIGVPFDLNHTDLAAAPAPLNVSAMFWTWAIGHKFVRVDVQTTDGVRWNMHLGSTMCASDGPTSAPVVECGRPNRPTITLASFDVDTDTVAFDIRALFAASDLTSDTPDTASGCQSFPDDVNECSALFPVLGLDFESGGCTNGCAGQTVFRVQ